MKCFKKSFFQTFLVFIFFFVRIHSQLAYIPDNRHDIFYYLHGGYINPINHNDSMIDIKPPTPIEASCLSYYSYLAKLGSKFTECVVNYSRPFRVCENCLPYYMRIREAQALIQGDVDLYATSLYEKGLKCKNIVEATDKVQTIVKIFSTIETIWESANCNDCFASTYYKNGTFNYTINSAYAQFYNMQEGLEYCIFNYTRNPITLDPLFESYTPNKTLCSKCKMNYVNLTDHFTSLGMEGEICMDVVDLFNYTRIVWSKGYKCNYRDFDQINVIVICSTVILATAIFYIAVRFCDKKKLKYQHFTNPNQRT